MAVMIGVDPHKRSHTAVAIDGDEVELASVTVRATRRQVDELLGWATRFEERTWAIESAGGLGYLLAQQLVAAGERVVDVPATLAARVRVLGSGRSNKNDSNDALSVAIAAMHAPRLTQVGRSDHSGVLRLYAKRNSDLGRARNRTACRLHALLAELVAGGIPKEINATSAQRMLASVTPASPVERARHALACEHLEDLRRFDEQMRASKRRLAAAVSESGTTLTELFGVGPVVAAMVIGYTGDVRRFANRDHYATYTGTSPIEMSSGGRVVHRLLASREPTTKPRDSHRRDHPDPLRALTGPRVLRPQSRRGQDEARSGARPQASDQRRDLPTAASRRREHGPGRENGDGSRIQRDRPRTPTAGASEEPLPDPTQR